MEALDRYVEEMSVVTVCERFLNRFHCVVDMLMQFSVLFEVCDIFRSDHKYTTVFEFFGSVSREVQQPLFAVLLNHHRGE